MEANLLLIPEIQVQILPKKKIIILSWQTGGLTMCNLMYCNFYLLSSFRSYHGVFVVAEGEGIN